MKSLSYALLVLPLLAAGVRAQDKIKESPYAPLAVGNAWHYRAGENKFILRVAKHERIDNVLTARVEMVVQNKAGDKVVDKVVATENLAVTDEGLCRFTYEEKKATPPILILKLPSMAGAKWEINSKVGSETLKGAFTAGEKAVTVPAGNFQTVTSTSSDMKADGTRISVTYYFAKDTGMVKEEVEVGGQKLVVELEKFEPAAKK